MRVPSLGRVDMGHYAEKLLFCPGIILIFSENEQSGRTASFPYSIARKAQIKYIFISNEAGQVPMPLMFI